MTTVLKKTGLVAASAALTVFAGCDSLRPVKPAAPDKRRPAEVLTPREQKAQGDVEWTQTMRRIDRDLRMRGIN